MGEGQIDDKAQLYLLLGELNGNTKSALDKLDKLESNLQNNYMPRTEIESRLSRLENAPLRWWPILIGGIALAWDIMNALAAHLK